MGCGCSQSRVESNSLDPMGPTNAVPPKHQSGTQKKDSTNNNLTPAPGGGGGGGVSAEAGGDLVRPYNDSEQFPMERVQSQDPSTLPGGVTRRDISKEKVVAIQRWIEGIRTPSPENILTLGDSGSGGGVTGDPSSLMTTTKSATGTKTHFTRKESDELSQQSDGLPSEFR
eukprot:PhF_6_TR19803/c0_g1_i1/m.28868